jgi:hypothetical protein
MSKWIHHEQTYVGDLCPGDVIYYFNSPSIVISVKNLPTSYQCHNLCELVVCHKGVIKVGILSMMEQSPVCSRERMHHEVC